LILDFLDATQASLGGSKSVVDQAAKAATCSPSCRTCTRWARPAPRPRHAKGLATCCHGEERTWWAGVSSGSDAPSTPTPTAAGAQGKADVLYVADAFEVLAKVNALLGGG